MAQHTKLIFVETIEELTKYSGEDTLVPLTLWVEREVQKRKLPFISIAPFVPAGEQLSSLLARVETIAHDWYRLPGGDMLQYKNISIGAVTEPMLTFYLGRLLYFIHTIDALLDAYPTCTEVVVEDTTKSLPATAGILAPFERTAVQDALRSVLPKYPHVQHPLSSYEIHKGELFPKSHTRYIFSLYNFLISLLPRLPHTLFASDYWLHLSPFLTKMADTQLILMDFV